MTVSEFTFLAMGLALGVAAGAALVEVLRARPPAPREVRVTVSQDAVPRRRAATLADDAFRAAAAEPARGGPADRRMVDDAVPHGNPDRRTPVRSVSPPRALAAVVGTDGVGEGSRFTPRQGAMIGVPVSRGADPMLRSMSAARNPSMTAVLDPPSAKVARSEGQPIATQTGSGSEASGEAAGTAAEASAAGAVVAVGAAPCADQRRVADERCELATRARAQATATEDALRSAQRTYDDHEARADEAGRIADPRAVRAAKDAAQHAFRGGRTTAHTTDEVEAAARGWLVEINRINADARDAGASATRERESALALVRDVERLSMDADVARIKAGTADAACLAAREAVADCEELAAGEVAATQPAVHSGAPRGLFTDEASPIGALGFGGTPRIFRLLRGDRSAMGELVAAMAGADPEERRRWQLALSDLVDAIVADSIAASALEFPADDPFWSPFTLAQNRDIASALSSLGYRFDGLGGWADGRVPSQRDLSLALGYTGLDPMRVRRWPTEAEMVSLLQDVTVAADEHLASTAGDLTLGELVTMLGRRADGLAEVWNQWGRLRPLLLEER